MGLAIKPETMMKFLKSIGYRFDRQEGSHHMYTNGKHTVPVPRHNKDLDIILIMKILNETGTTKKELLKWLGR